MNPAARIQSVMVIDDDSILLKHHRRIVERSKLVDNAFGFSNAEDALDFLCQSERPAINLILLDLNMPGMNGFEFVDEAARQLEESFRDIIVVMLSSSLTPQSIEKGERSSIISSYINKPLTIDIFQDIVSSYNEIVSVRK